MFLKNLKIGARLGLAFSAVLALTLILMVIGILRLQDIASATAEMDVSLEKLRLADAWSTGNRTNEAMTQARLRAADASDDAAVAAMMKENSAAITQTKEKLEALIASEEGKRQLAMIAARRQEYIDIRNQVFALKNDPAQDPAEIRNLIQSRMTPSLAAYNGSIQELGNLQLRIFNASKAQVDAMVDSGRAIMAVFGSLALALGTLLAWLLTRSVTRPLREALAVARTVADGDLSRTVAVSSSDETGQLMAALKAMNENLERIVARVRTGADAIAASSVQVASGNQDLSSRTEQQASSLEETASSMEELTSTVRHNAENARQGSQLAASASEIASRGGAVVAQVVDTMGAINESSRKIVDIIGVIDGIAFQTNILALNAAVEAARAGEQGRGFAVVASEVRGLAQRSAAAAREIKGLIDDSVEKVGTGSRLVDEAGATMQEIVQSVRQVTDIMGEIAAASREQSEGIEQVNQAVGQMDQVTQQNAALVEEAAAATETMQEQARSLAEAVSVFKLRGGAGRLAASASAVAARQASARPSPASAVPALPARASALVPARKHAGDRAPAMAGDEWEAF